MSLSSGMILSKRSMQSATDIFIPLNTKHLLRHRNSLLPSSPGGTKDLLMLNLQEHFPPQNGQLVPARVSTELLVC